MNCAYELYIEPERPQRYKGRFLPGFTPHNKGRKITEWMSADNIKKILSIGIKNLRPNPNLPGMNKKVCIGVKDGRMVVFPSITHAARATGALRENVKKCCQHKRHTAKGWTFYYESDYDGGQ